MSAQVAMNRNIKNRRIIKRGIRGEETEILDTLQNLKKDLDCLHLNLDYVTDPILIDSYIYEIKSIHMKYQYYLKLCKEMSSYEKRA